MTKILPAIGVALAALVALVAPACSSEDPVVAADSDVVNVKVTDDAFEPAQVKAKVGQTVRFTWAGGSHNVVSGARCTHDGKFKSGATQAGGTYERKFETAGSFPYYCEPHCETGMTGEVIVEP